MADEREHAGVIASKSVGIVVSGALFVLAGVFLWADATTDEGAWFVPGLSLAVHLISMIFAAGSLILASAWDPVARRWAQSASAGCAFGVTVVWLAAAPDAPLWFVFLPPLTLGVNAAIGLRVARKVSGPHPL